MCGGGGGQVKIGFCEMQDLYFKPMNYNLDSVHIG